MAFSWDRSPISTRPISVVIPAYQAAGGITAVAEALVPTLDKLARDYEVLVVDDGSADGTSGKVEELSKRFHRVRLIRHDQPQGYGVALADGLKAAQYPLIFTLPADASCKPDVLCKFLEVVNDVDIVCGVRTPRPAGAGKVQSWIAYLMFGLRILDSTCPVRLYRRGVFDLLPIQAKGTFADVEILAKANFLECLMTEVDIDWQLPAEPSPWKPIAGDQRRVFLHPRFGQPKPPAEPTPAA